MADTVHSYLPNVCHSTLAESFKLLLEKNYINWIPDLGSCSSQLMHQNFKPLQRKIVMHIVLYCIV